VVTVLTNFLFTAKSHRLQIDYPSGCYTLISHGNGISRLNESSILSFYLIVKQRGTSPAILGDPVVKKQLTKL